MPNSHAIRLAASSPSAVNNSLASLARQCGVELRVSRDMEAKYDRTGAFVGYEPNGKTLAIVNGSPEAIDAMRSRMEGAFAAPVEDQVELWLAELDQIAPRRASSSADDDLRMNAYLSRLMAYPADVVREAVLQHRWRFFPSWAELADVCDELVAHRRAVRAELDRAADRIREQEMRARALPDEATCRRTEDEEREARKRAVESVGDLLSDMLAKAEAEDAKAKADQGAAIASYVRFRGASE